MKKYLVGSACALTLLAGVAFAQTSSTDSTTSTMSSPSMAAPVAPMPGSMATSESRKSIDSNGDETVSHKATYGNAYGSGSESSSTTVTPAAPPPPPVSTTTTRSSTSTSD